MKAREYNNYANHITSSQTNQRHVVKVFAHGAKVNIRNEILMKKELL